MCIHPFLIYYLFHLELFAGDPILFINLQTEGFLVSMLHKWCIKHCRDNPEPNDSDDSACFKFQIN